MMKRVNYRKIYMEHYGCRLEDMSGMDVHHIDGNHNNNEPSNLMLVTPEEHARIHEHEFIIWARKGALIGNAVFRNRLNNKGKTEKELAYKMKRVLVCKLGLHRKPHKESSKKIISEKKKQHLQNKLNQPLWGRSTYKITDPDGKVYIVSGGWKEWCLERNLNPSNLRKVALGERSSSKGWKAEFYNE
jgi:hypothetical protein